MADLDGDHLAERVDLHTVVAGFRRYSLSSRDLAAIRRTAVERVAAALDVPLAAAGRWTGVGRLTVIDARAAVGWLPADTGEDVLSVDGTSWATAGVETADVETADVETADVAGFWTPARPGAVGLSVAVLPAGTPWGRLGVAASGGRSFTPPEVDFLRAIANLLAAAVERARGERAQTAVSGFGLFALQSRRVPDTTARAVDVVTDVLEAPMAVLVRAVTARVGGGPASGLMEVVAARAVPGWPAGARFVADGDPRRFGAVAVFAAPVLVDGEAWGRLVVLDRWARPLSHQEAGFVESVTHMLAAAIARGQVEERLRETTRQLQQALLPTELPELPGVQAAGRYAAVAGNDVGGDWFDVLPLPDGGLGLVIGDVEGHDSTAASVMGQVRNVLRAYAAEGHTPEEVVARLGRFVADRTSRLVSCLYAEVHPAERTITLVSAGHQPPLALDGALRPVRLRLETGVMLGADPRHRYVERTSLLPPGATLVFATDGLVGGERAVHPGPREVLGVLARAGSPGSAAEELLVTDHPLADDAAVLVVRLSPASGPAGTVRGGPRDAVRRGFRSHASAPPAARRFVSDMLAEWGLADLEDVAVLVLSELMTNAVVHTTGPIELSLHRSAPGRLWIGVRDDSDRPPVVSPADPDDLGGRGLSIVAALAERWGSTPMPGRGGKTVWAELAADPDGRNGEDHSTAISTPSRSASAAAS